MSKFRISLDEYAPAQKAVADFLVTPPTGTEGYRCIVDSGATGAFTGHTYKIAYFTGGSWYFDQPESGWKVWVTADSLEYMYFGGTWVPSGSNNEYGTAQGQMAFWQHSELKWKHTEVSELFWDDTNKRLEVGGELRVNARIQKTGNRAELLFGNTTGNVVLSTDSGQVIGHKLLLTDNVAYFSNMLGTKGFAVVDSYPTVLTNTITAFSNIYVEGLFTMGIEKITTANFVTGLETELNTKYLRLDTDNDPLTNSLTIRLASGQQTDTLGDGTLNFDVATDSFWSFRQSATNLSDLAFDRKYAGVWYEAMRIQRSTGYVGIGTTAPNRTLDVNGIIGLEYSGSEKGYLYPSPTGMDVSFTGNSGAVRFDTRNLNSSYFTAGNFGFGVTVPLAKVHINGGVGSLSTGLAFGDGDSGFFENSDDDLRLWLGGSQKWIFLGDTMYSVGSGSGAYLRRNSSSAIPAFGFAGDTNTGIGWALEDNLSLITGGVEAIRIDSSGRVGFNTIPNTVFRVHSAYSGNNIMLIEGGTLAQLTLQDGTGAVDSKVWSIRNNAPTLSIGTQLDVYDGYAESIRFNRSGNISIGNTNDTYKLDVSGTTSFRAGVYFGSSGGNEGLISWGATGFVIRGQSSQPLSLGSDGRSSDLVIDTTGYVTISNIATSTSDSVLVETAGVIQKRNLSEIITGGLDSVYLRLDTANDPLTNYLEIEAANNTGLIISSTGYGSLIRHSRNGGSYSFYAGVDGASHSRYGIFNISMSPLFLVHSTGNVSIGTSTTDSGDKLNVAGNINISGFNAFTTTNNSIKSALVYPLVNGNVIFAASNNGTATGNLILGYNNPTLNAYTANVVLYSNLLASDSSNTLIQAAGNIYQTNVNRINYFAGKVGIGTTSPQTILEISKDTSSASYGTYPAIMVNNPNVAGYAMIGLSNGTGVSNLIGRMVILPDNTMTVGTYASEALQFDTNQNVRYTISNTGHHDFKTGTATFGNDITVNDGRLELYNANSYLWIEGTVDATIWLKDSGAPVDEKLIEIKSVNGRIDWIGHNDAGTAETLMMRQHYGYGMDGLTRFYYDVTIRGRITSDEATFITGAADGYIAVSDADGDLIWTDPSTLSGNHNHDDRYYTETESDAKYLLIDSDIAIGNHEFYATDISGLYHTSAIEISEVANVGNTQTGNEYAPALAFHWDGISQGQLAMGSNSRLVWRDGSSFLSTSKIFETGRFSSTVASGTSPFMVVSPTLVSNLNADMVDGIHADRIIYGDANNNRKATQYGDWSSLYTSGFYWAPSTGIEIPSPDYYGLISSGYVNNATHAIQFAGSLNVANRLYYRLKTASLSAWYQVLHSGNYTEFISGMNYWTKNGTNLYYTGGNVGIGTSNPGNQLTLEKSVSTYLDIRNTGGANKLMIGAETGLNSIISRNLSTGAIPLRFMVGTTESMRIDTNGNVGIGTTNPTYTLDVYGSTRVLYNGTHSLFVQHDAGLNHSLYAIYVQGQGQQRFSVTSGGRGYFQNTLTHAAATVGTESALLSQVTAAVSIPSTQVAYGNAAGTGITSSTGLIYDGTQLKVNKITGLINPNNYIDFDSTSGEYITILAGSKGLSLNSATNTAFFGDFSYGVGSSASGLAIFADTYVDQTLTHVLVKDNIGLSLWANIADFGNGYWTQTGSNIYYNTGNVGIGTTAPISTYRGLDIASGGLSLIIGAENASSNRTDANPKYGRIAGVHNLSASEEPIGLIGYSSTGSGNTVFIGGGSSSFNSANEIKFYTGPTYITTTGTQRMVIDKDGLIGIGIALPDASLHLYKDQDDATQMRVSNPNTGTSAVASIRVDSGGYSTLFMQHGSGRTITRYGVSLAGASEIWSGSTNGPLILGTGFTSEAIVFGSSNTERMRIHTNGYVGIGTSDPQSLLQVDGTVNLSEIGWLSTSVDGTNFIKDLNILGYSGNTSYTGSISFSTQSSDNDTIEVMRIINDKVGIGITNPTYQFQVSTDSAAKPSTNTWSIGSDYRIKTSVMSWTDGLNTILGIRPVSYHYNGAGGIGYDDTSKEHIGIIAQELELIAPYMVETRSGFINGVEVTDFKSYQGHALPFLLVNAVKELNDRDNSLEAQIQALQQRVTDLETEVELLKSV